MEILDASALLAFLKKENGYKPVQNLLKQAQHQGGSVMIHQINYIEVVKKLLQYIGEHETKKVLADLKQPFLGVANYMDEDLATYATHMTSHAQISLADGIGLAFTKAMEGRFWTADKALKKIASELKIALVLIRN